MMRYTKPALTFDQQAQQLVDRGLIVSDKEILTQALRTVNYYRLSAYWYPFKYIDPDTGEERFVSNTTFNKIWRRYTFDRRLRLLVMDALEHIEVAILRTRMVEQFTVIHGPFGYTNRNNFNPKFSQRSHVRLMKEIRESIKRSREEFIERFHLKYSEESDLPLWIVAEVMTFGQLYTFFRFLHHDEKKKLAQTFDLYPPVMESWLHTLNFIRNTCAHHARLWNREIPIRPKIPDKKHQREWHNPVKLDNRRVLAILTLIKYLLGRIDPCNDWKVRLLNLLEEYPDIPIRLMGFPPNWLDCPLWE